MTKNYLDLLKETLSVQSSSGKEELVIAFIKNFVETRVPEATIEIKDNNVYVTKGVADYYPCIVSHTDTVHDIYEDFGVYERDGVLFAFSNDTETQVGIGGDDKVGVWIGLQMLLDKEAVKCAFFHSEEIGCVGSSDADMSFFDNVGYAFQSDRRGHKDFVNNIYGVKLFSEEFSQKISPVLHTHGYQETDGALTDVYQLKLNGLDVCVANMSSGYYAPHSEKEIVDVVDAINCLDMISALIDLLGMERYEQKYETPKSISFKKKKKNPYGWGYDFDYDHSYWYDENLKDYKSEDYLDDESLKIVGSCEYCHDEVYKSEDFGEEFGFCNGCQCLVANEMIHLTQ